MSEDYRDKGTNAIRTLFCLGVRPDFFAAGAEERTAVITTIKEAFADLSGRFGVTVLGTMDDDEFMVGPSDTFPWTAYILADVPSYEQVVAICGIIRDTAVGDAQLWKYLKIEARAGRRLFFGNE